MVDKGHFDDKFDDFLKSLSGEEREGQTPQTTPQIPVEETKSAEEEPAKIAAIEYSDDDSLELLNSLSDLGSAPEEEPEVKPVENKPATESVAQPVNPENDPLADLAELFSEEPDNHEIEDALRDANKDKPVQAEVKPAEEEIKSLDESSEESLEDELADILGGTAETEPAATPKQEVKLPTPKTVYEPSQEITSESYFGETGSFDDSEMISDDLFATLDENSFEKDKRENLTETPAQVPVQNVEMPEDLFLEDFSSEKSSEAEVKPVEQAKTIEDDLKNSPVEKQTNYQKRTPYISFEGITWKRGVLYCVGGLAIFFGAYFSAPILEKYVPKFNGPVQEKTVNTTPSQLETTAQEAQNNPAENYQEPSTTSENSTGTNNTETKTTEKPSLKELFHKRYHK